MATITRTSAKTGHRTQITATTARGLRRALVGFTGWVSRSALELPGVVECQGQVCDAQTGAAIAYLTNA
jgi:hypothetical protein